MIFFKDYAYFFNLFFKKIGFIKNKSNIFVYNIFNISV
jgi:hypothetical protein